MKVETWGQLVDALILRKVSFVVAFFVIFFLSYAFLAWIDFLPEPITDNRPDSFKETVKDAALTVGLVKESVATNTVAEAKVATPLYPDTIIIDKLKRTIPVENPTSRTIADLDAALLYGVVRHPDSATLEQKGTVFILGHSSYLPTVMNHNFQAFNGIQNLVFGDTIKLQSGNIEYVYRVDRVYRARTSDVTVPIAGDFQRLVLATCNSFGKVDDRYIVESALLETKQID